MTVPSSADVLRHCGLSDAEVEDTGMPVLTAPDEEFKKTFDKVSLIAGGEHDLGQGLLHFTNMRIVWCKDGAATAATFQSISMHALSRDTEFYKKACIYCQLDEPEELAAAFEEDMVCSHEIMLVPEDESAVDAIFESLCEGAEANPDAMDGDEGEFFFDQAEVAAGLDEDAQQRLVELEDRLQLPTAEQFEEMVAADGPDQLDGSIEQSAGAGAIERADQVQHDPS